MKKLHRFTLPKGQSPRAIARMPLPDLVVDQLRGMIEAGELPPGAAIAEKPLCELFGVSRTPLREALKQLGSEGMVELRPRRAALVASVDAAEIAASFDVLAALERLAGHDACIRMTTSELAELEAQHRELRNFHTTQERAAYGDCNRAIHARILELAGNPILKSVCAPLNARTMRARASVNLDAHRWQESIEEHDRFMECFRRKDPVGAGDALGEHTARTGKAIVSFLHEIEAARDDF